MLFIVPLFFFVSHQPSPGAGDNLNGSSIAYHLGKFFADRKSQGNALKYTRLIVLSTDGEEAGQRGAAAYVKRHKEELLRIPTVVLNFDSIYSLKDILILTKDRHGALPLSESLVEECLMIAHEAGYPVKSGSIPFGSGTDAAPFAKAGIEAVGIIGLPTSLFEKDRVYHTTKDTVDQISPEAVAAVLHIAANEILRRDQLIASK
ncbi:MAG: M28 family peptidase [Eubacteriales bacterium]